MLVVWHYYLGLSHHQDKWLLQFGMLPLTQCHCVTTSGGVTTIMVMPPPSPPPPPQEDIIYEWQCHECNFMNSSDLSIAVFCNHGGWEYEIGSRSVSCVMLYDQWFPKIISELFAYEMWILLLLLFRRRPLFHPPLQYLGIIYQLELSSWSPLLQICSMISSIPTVILCFLWLVHYFVNKTQQPIMYHNFVFQCSILFEKSN